jgi:DNA (cytosine-5)-methyltransferase 1
VKEIFRITKSKSADKRQAFVGFGGFGGPEIALHEVEIETTSVELDPDIAEVSQRNGNNVIVADILTVNPSDYSDWWLYHFSPPCPSFSVARSKKSKQNVCQCISDLARFQQLLNGESEIDLQLSWKICQFIKIGRPEYFTLENVWAYRNSLSFMNIWYALLEEGYGVDWWHLNAADYGVPQSRKRMIVIARRDGRKPVKPWPTHSKVGDMFTKAWRGWYEAIEDLTPNLPETQFAEWQMDRMPDYLKTKKLRTFILGQGNYSKPKDAAESADTVTANGNQTGVKAFIINSQNANRGLTVRSSHEPTMTVTANLLEKNSPPKAFIIADHNGSIQKDNSRKLAILEARQPVFTVTVSVGQHATRAISPSGRVVAMTPRCLARFQDFPDWFELPNNRALACRGIGNALPPGTFRAILKTLA